MLLEQIRGELREDQLVVSRPRRGPAPIAPGATLLVGEGESAVLLVESQALDTFSAGAHQLGAETAPLLAAETDLTAPFRAEVCFVSSRQLEQQKWGTLDPVLLPDSRLGLVRLRALGMYSVHVCDPQKFVQILTSTVTELGTESALDFMRSLAIARMADYLRGHLSTVLDLPTWYDELCSGIEGDVRTGFGECGISLDEFRIYSLTPPPLVQERLERG